MSWDKEEFDAFNEAVASKNEVRVVFANEEQAQVFMNFMNCWGEQAYWDWTDDKPSVGRFEYDYENKVIKGIEG